MRRALARAAIIAAFAALILTAPTALAHSGGLGSAVETRFAFPPWVVWLTGAGVVAVSFAVVGAFLSKDDVRTGRARHARELSDAPPPLPRAVTLAGRAAGLLALALLAANAVAGARSLLPEALVWLVLWAFLPVVAYVAGNPWPIVSPFHALAPLADRVRGGRPPRAYPERLAAWPAVALLVAIIGLEVAGAAGRDPVTLARVAVAYSAFTLAGMAAFGSATWLANAEAVTRAFRWWSALAPVQRTRRGLAWRIPGEGARDLPHAGASDVAFTVALLYGVNFDGFLATRAGAAASSALAGVVGDALAHVGLLVAGFGVFLGAYWLAARLIRKSSESLDPLPEVAAAFAASLLPIAAAYHLAHNLFYAVENAPRVWSALTDPLGLGWGSAVASGYAAPLALPAAFAPAVAAFQIGVIVAGHVLAVVVAHRLAFDAFPSRVQAIRSELPLTIIMVFYTLVGLWILSSGHAGGVA